MTLPKKCAPPTARTTIVFGSSKPSTTRRTCSVSTPTSGPTDRVSSRGGAELVSYRRHRREPHAFVSGHVIDEAFQHQHATSPADALRMHGQHEDAGAQLLYEIVELAGPDV